MRMEDKEIKELEKAVEQIWEVARQFGLDPYPTNFEIVPATVMYEVGSYALPGRYSHWTFVHDLCLHLRHEILHLLVDHRDHVALPAGE